MDFRTSESRLVLEPVERIRQSRLVLKPVEQTGLGTARLGPARVADNSASALAGTRAEATMVGGLFARCCCQGAAMSTRLSLLSLLMIGWNAVLLDAQTPPPVAPSAPNQLSKMEQAAGWKLLFDGRTPTSWRAYRGQAFPDKGWKIEDGCLRAVAGAGGGDIITADQFADFELELEWKVAAKANSGIMYRVQEKHETAWQTGPEYQIIDDAGNNIGPTAHNACGALYDLYPPSDKKVVKPVGEFNVTRIRWKDGLLSHWLNGVKIVECRTDGDEWKQKIAASKFKGYGGFGVQPRGHIALQNYGNDVWFRSIKVRDLDAPLAGEVKLFNGKDLTGWKPILPEGAKPQDVWSVKDGVLICQGKPAGYIRTERDYKNYVLKLDWRFAPQHAGNSGVLLRVQPPDKVWPRCIEAQLLSENAGDFWNIDEFPMKVDASRTEGRNTKKTHMAERPVGEWNDYEIIVNGGRVTLKVNGDVLNEAWDALESAGKIALQSEGAEIHFRNVRLAPLE
jgi:hypothetical protein